MHFMQTLLTPVLLFLSSIATGCWLSHKVRPLNPILLTVHKLLALAGAVTLALLLRNLFRQVDFSIAILIVCGLAAAAVVALFITGALLSRPDGASPAVLRIHTIATGLLVISLIMMGGSLFRSRIGIL